MSWRKFRWMASSGKMDDARFRKKVGPIIGDKGEYQTMKRLGHAKGDSLFDQHRSTWITETDIQEIASAGLNTVRVPVGYWIMGFDPYDVSNKRKWQVFAPGSLKYLDTLINNWALKYNVAVLVDIHAAKGSQNGRDHSAATDFGRKYWSQYSENVNNTIALAKFIAGRYRNTEAFLGVGLLNEPEAPTNVDILKNYYIRAIDEIRATGDDCVLVHMPLLTQQGPRDLDWAAFTPPPRYQNVWHEWHKYLVWGFEGQSEDQIMNQGVQGIANDIAAWNGNCLFIGEWSLASPGSAPFSDINKLKEYSKRMIAALSRAHSGWTFWSWKLSNDLSGRDGWSMRSLLRDGIIKW